MRPKLQVAPLYLRKVRDLEGIDGRYFGILSGLPPAGRHRSRSAFANMTVAMGAAPLSSQRNRAAR